HRLKFCLRIVEHRATKIASSVDASERSEHLKILQQAAREGISLTHRLRAAAALALDDSKEKFCVFAIVTDAIRESTRRANETRIRIPKIQLLIENEYCA